MLYLISVPTSDYRQYAQTGAMYILHVSRSVKLVMYFQYNIGGHIPIHLHTPGVVDLSNNKSDTSLTHQIPYSY